MNSTTAHLSTKSRTSLIVTCLLLAVAKLWLIHGSEIVAIRRPHDDLWYVHAAKYWYWFAPQDPGNFDIPPFIRLPGYPIFIALNHLTGVPLRVSIEVSLVLGALVLATAIDTAARSRALAVALFTAIVFHPASFEINAFSSTNSLYAAMLALSVGLVVRLLLNRHARSRHLYALASGAALAGLWHVREEGIVILAFLALCGLGVVALDFNSHSWRSWLSPLWPSVAIPALTVFLVTAVVNTANYVTLGLFAPSAMFSSGFKGLGRALLQIRPDHYVRYVPVTSEMRQRAYRVSPAFQKLESYLEGEPGRAWAAYSKRNGVTDEGEIGGSHFWWALNAAVWQAARGTSLRDADEHARRAALEIDAACEDGRLQCRWAFSSKLDPDVRGYVRFLPASGFHLARSLVSPYEVPAQPGDDPNPAVRALFDEMTDRRAGLVGPQTTTIIGWAFDTSDTIQSVMLRDGEGQTLAVATRFTPRPDVRSFYAAGGVAAPLNVGFRLVAASVLSSNADLVFHLRDRGEVVVSRQSPGSNQNPPTGLLFYIDVDQTTARPSYPREARIQAAIGAWYGPLTRWLTYLALASLVALLICRKSGVLRDTTFIAIMVLTAAVITRFAFLTLLDAASHVIVQIRHLYPVMGLYTGCLILLNAHAIRIVAAGLTGRSATREPVAPVPGSAG